MPRTSPTYAEPLIALIDQFIEPQGMWSDDDYMAFDRNVPIESKRRRYGLLRGRAWGDGFV